LPSYLVESFGSSGAAVEASATALRRPGQLVGLDVYRVVEAIEGGLR
jgi:hypothetical protein